MVCRDPLESVDRPLRLFVSSSVGEKQIHFGDHSGAASEHMSSAGLTLASV